ncbi:MAG: RNA polymerase sigma factor, partial [Ktedonobacteraceae bacterium]|nr:RNA polymerase sigma factor [Ktedonobacteraceae bacterium]
ILVKIVTHLSEFRGESAFSTWVYRIATNYLLTTRKRRAEQREMTLQMLGEQLDYSLALGEAEVPDDYEERLLIEEVQFSCILGMLICLDRVHRITLILGEIFEVTSEEGAYIMETTPVNFRKRLSRARNQIRGFVQQKCGIVNPANPCRCSKHIGNKIQYRLLNPDRLKYAKAVRVPSFEEIKRKHVQEMCELEDTAALFQTLPAYAVPERAIEGIKELLHSGRFSMFDPLQRKE